MKIGFLTADLTHHHGWAHYSTSLILALHRQGIQTEIVAARNTPPDPHGELNAAPLLPSVAPLDDRFLLRMFRYFPRIRSLLKDCDAIHTTIEYYAPLAALIAGKRPLYITIHGSYAHLPRIRRWPIGTLYEWAYRRAKLVCVSTYTESVVQGLYPGVDTVVVNNAVDVERFANLPKIPGKCPTVLTAGGVKKRKGTLPLIRAMAKVREAIPDVQCIVLGNQTSEAAYVAQVKNTIKELGLEDCVQMPGFVDSETLRGWYGTANVFVLPSQNDGWKFEGFGLVHLEASAAGLPVIGTTNCGAESAIDDGVTGLLVEQEYAEEELPQAIIEMLTNPERAKQMGAAGKQKAQSMTWDHAAQHLSDIYRHTRIE